MKYGLKTVAEYQKSKKIEPKEGDRIVSITNNCRLIKGKVYVLSKKSLYLSVKNNGGDDITDMSLFVYEFDWLKKMREIKLNKLGI